MFLLLSFMLFLLKISEQEKITCTALGRGEGGVRTTAKGEGEGKVVTG
jgi:hypothetical protein